MWAWALAGPGRASLATATPRAVAGAAAAGLVCYYAGALLDFKALMVIDAGIERVLIFAYPSMVVVLHALLHRRWPRRGELACLLLTYLGILLVVSGFDVRILSANLAGAGLVLGCAFTFALYYLASARWAHRLGSLLFSAVALTASGTALGVHYLVVRGLPQPAAWSLREAALMAGLVLFATVLPMFCMVEGVRRLGAPRAALISTVGPPATIALGAVLFGESLTIAQWLGVVLIGGGILVLELARRMRPVA